MSGNRFLADTNTFIFLLARHPSLESFLESQWHYTFITEIELLSKTNLTVKEVKRIERLLKACTKLQYTDEVNRITISLRRRHKIKIPDAIIAASAIHANLPLITFDKDFAKVSTLDIVLLEP